MKISDIMQLSQELLNEQIYLRGFIYEDRRRKKFAYIDYRFFEEWSVNDISLDGSSKKVSMWTESVFLDKEFIIELIKSIEKL